MGFPLPKVVYFASGIGTVIGGSYLLKDYMSGPKYENKNVWDDKVAIVTGSNTGIGKEVARGLAKSKVKVIMACRDMEKCEETRHDIVLESNNKYVYCRKCDLASQQSIRDFVTEFKKEHSKLHILINNAGIMRCPKSYTEEGIEMQLGVNHMGHFLLTNLLLDVLRDSKPARIINVTSTAHTKGTINLKDLNSDENYDPAKAYAQSKLANILFTRKLANTLKDTGITVNAVHPGVVNTEILRHIPVYKSFYTKYIIRPLTWLVVKSPYQGAQPVIFAALDPAYSNVTGSYFSSCKETDLSGEATSDQVADWLWAVSEKWTKLNSV